MTPIHYRYDLPVFTARDGRLHPSPIASGPWYPGTQHGSAMLLMAAIAAERHPSRVARHVVRLTVDMMKAAPMAAVELCTESRREGQHMDVIDISLRAGGVEYVRASALRLRINEVPVTDAVRYNGPIPTLPPPLDFRLFPEADAHDGFHHALEIRVDTSSHPGLAWFRVTHPTLDNAPVTPLQRAALAADWTYSVPGLVNEVRTREGFGKTPFFGINPDTTLQLSRPPQGEWIGIQTTRCYDDAGAGIAFGQLFDEYGAFGACTQSVLIRPRPTPA